MLALCALLLLCAAYQRNAGVAADVQDADDHNQPIKQLVAGGGHALKEAAAHGKHLATREPLHGAHTAAEAQALLSDDDDDVVSDFFLGAAALFVVGALALFFCCGYYVGAASRSPIFNARVPLMAGGKPSAPVYRRPPLQAPPTAAAPPPRSVASGANQQSPVLHRQLPIVSPASLQHHSNARHHQHSTVNAQPYR